jgi:hypothetical protein
MGVTLVSDVAVNHAAHRLELPGLVLV